MGQYNNTEVTEEHPHCSINEPFEHGDPTAHSLLIMGCAHSRDHPKNINLVKLKKKYDAEPIRKAKLLNIWVIGAEKQKSKDIALLMSENGGYLYVNEDSLLQTEMAAGTERGKIILEILHDKGTVCPGIILDLAIEKILDNLPDLKGVIFQGLPRDREQAWHLQQMVGPVNAVIYAQLSGDKLKSALTGIDDDPHSLKEKVEHFQKIIIHLAKHKNVIKVDGSSDTNIIVEECLEKIKAIHRSKKGACSISKHFM